jgi:hypothetical protein
MRVRLTDEAIAKLRAIRAHIAEEADHLSHPARRDRSADCDALSATAPGRPRIVPDGLVKRRVELCLALVIDGDGGVVDVEIVDYH